MESFLIIEIFYYKLSGLYKFLVKNSIYVVLMVVFDMNFFLALHAI